MQTAPARPAGVPAAATYVPGGDSFDALREVAESHTDKRSYLRISVPFVLWRFDGVMLQHVMHRALSVNRRTWSMGRCLIWSDDTRPVPGVWVWTLADQRAEEVDG
jgi:hypothetical protein